jgi:hypothetical protein
VVGLIEDVDRVFGRVWQLPGGQQGIDSKGKAAYIRLKMERNKKMATPIAVEMTPKGILIPRAALQGWGEVQVMREKNRIVIQPKTLTLAQEHELMVQALREDGLLYDPESEADLSAVLDEERAELAKKFSVERPLSEIVTEERDEGV